MTKGNNLTCEVFFSQLRKSDSLWSAIAWIAAYIVQHERTASPNKEIGHLPFKQWKNNSTGIDFQRRINHIFSVLSSHSVNKKQARTFAEHWIDLASGDISNLINLCRSTLIELDTSTDPAYNENLPGAQRIAPLNSPSDGSNILVIPRMNTSLQSDYLARMRVRRGRNLQISNPDSMLSQLKNYMFIPISALHSREIEIIHYSTPQIMEYCRNGLRISIAPIARERWFNALMSAEEETFTISYPDQDLNDRVNDLICDIIQREAEDGSNVVIFPELVMNSDTVQCVKQFLLRNDMIKDNVFLILLGTCWSNYRNEGCALSGSGTELFRCQKQTRHEFYNSEDGITYIEQLDDSNKTLSLLDVPTIGRIGWRICRDFLNPDLNYTYQALDTSMEIVSCFSNRLCEMYSTAEANVQLTGRISIVVNKCIQDKTSAKAYHGFCCVPRIDSNRSIHPNPLHFDLCGVCDVEKCCYSRCAHHFTISRDIDFIETGRWYEKDEIN